MNEYKPVHIPVLLTEIIKYFNPLPGQNFVDCTIGEAGHSIAILNKTKPNGKILGIDANASVLEQAKNRIASIGIDLNRLIFVNNNFSEIKNIVKQKHFENISGILFDLGLSSWILEKSKMGFSFQKNEALDMRFDKSLGITAKDIVNTFSEKQLVNIFQEYGEENVFVCKKIAKRIIQNRPIQTSGQLSNLIFGNKTKARIFQALRIIVNNELNNLQNALLDAMKLTNKIIVISYHSLEDRIVKQTLKNSILIRPTKNEIINNQKARSAKMRFWKL